MIRRRGLRNQSKGIAILRNPSNHGPHKPWCQVHGMRPRIVHFLGASPGSFPYGHELTRLRSISERKCPVWLASAWAWMSFSLPLLARELSKDLFRPLYRLVFGYRRVKGGRDP